MVCIVKKPIINKKTGQINVYINKKDLPKDFPADKATVKFLRMRLEGWG